MAKEVVKDRRIGIRQAGVAFSVNGCRYRYERKLSHDNGNIQLPLIIPFRSKCDFNFFYAWQA